MRGAPELPERLGLRGLGEHLIGPGGVLGRQERGLIIDDEDVDRVDLPGGQGREGPRQPAGHRAGVRHLVLGGLRGQVHFPGQLLGREFPEPAPRGRPWSGGAAGGELADGRQVRPDGAGFHPAGGADDPEQLVVGQAGQRGTVTADGGVHQRGQHRPGTHGVRGTAGSELGGQVLHGPVRHRVLARVRGGDHGVQVRVGVPVVLRPVPCGGPLPRAAGPRVACPATRERIRGHEPPFRLEESSGNRCEHYIISRVQIHLLYERFFKIFYSGWAYNGSMAA